MSNGSALYYPRIEFPDLSWLKQSALYWDKIYRIAPLPERDASRAEFEFFEHPPKSSGYAPIAEARLPEPGWAVADPAEVTGVWDGHGSGIQDVVVAFKALIGERAEALRARYRVEFSNGHPVTCSPTDGQVSWVLGWKMDPELVESLLRNKLGALDPTASDSFKKGPEFAPVALHPELASIYMTALALLCSRAWGSKLLTHRALHAAAGAAKFDLSTMLNNLAGALLAEKPPASSGRSSDEMLSAVVAVALPTIAIRDPHAVPAERIVRFHHEHEQGRRALRKRVEEIAASLEDVKNASPQDFADIVAREWKQTLRHEVEQLREELEQARIPTIAGAFGLFADASVKPALASAALVAWNLIEPITGAAVTAIGATVLGGVAQSDNVKNARAAAKAKAPAATYLLAVEDLAAEPAALARQLASEGRRYLPYI